MKGLIVLSVLVTSLVSPELPSQTKFQWPNNEDSGIRYKYWETCKGTTYRTVAKEIAIDSVLEDTLPHSNFVRHSQTSKTLANVVGKCMQSFGPDAIALKDAFYAQQIYLAYNNDQRAWEIVQKKLNSIPIDSPLAKAVAIHTAIDTYINAKPARIAEALNLYKVLDESAITYPAISRVRIIGTINFQAWNTDAMDSIDRIRKMQIKLAKSLSEEEWLGQPGIELSVYIYESNRRYYKDRLADSLAKGVDAYKSLMTYLFDSLVGRPNRADAILNVVGKKAEKVYGDFWFPRGMDTNSEFPRKGEITLIVAMNHDMRFAAFAHLDRATASVLNRLKQKYPSLNIVLIAKTVGHFGRLEPPVPEAEAKMLDSLYLKFYKIPAILAVTNTQFWRLPGFDQRRINEPTQNGENDYERTGYLVDRYGRIGIDIALNRAGERDLEWMIPAILKNSGK